MRQREYIEKMRSVLRDRTASFGHCPTFFIETLGCQMNAKDSEKFAGILKEIGYEKAPLSRAFKRARGKLFPIGWLFILLAFWRYKKVDLMLLGSAPEWHSKGLSAIFHTKLETSYYKMKIKTAISNPQIETNIAAIKVWDSYKKEFYMRRRCWIRKIR